MNDLLETQQHEQLTKKVYNITNYSHLIDVVVQWCFILSNRDRYATLSQFL